METRAFSLHCPALETRNGFARLRLTMRCFKASARLDMGTGQFARSAPSRDFSRRQRSYCAAFAGSASSRPLSQKSYQSTFPPCVVERCRGFTS